MNIKIVPLEANKVLFKPLSTTEIQRSKWHFPEEQPPSSGPHQTSALLAFSNRQPGVRLPNPGRTLQLTGSLQPEHKQPTFRTRSRRSGGRDFLQRVHHSHSGSQTGGRFHQRAFGKPWKVQRCWFTRGMLKREVKSGKHWAHASAQHFLTTAPNADFITK